MKKTKSSLQSTGALLAIGGPYHGHQLTHPGTVFEFPVHQGYRRETKRYHKKNIRLNVNTFAHVWVYESLPDARAKELINHLR